MHLGAEFNIWSLFLSWLQCTVPQQLPSSRDEVSVTLNFKSSSAHLEKRKELSNGQCS